MKKIIEYIKANYKIVTVTLLVGLLFGYLIAPSPNQQLTDSTPKLESTTIPLSEQIHTCSMHPQIRQKGPGLCPICAMDLIPVTTNDNNQIGANPNEIQMSETAAQLANIQTTTVTYGKRTRDIHLLGRVEADESKMAEITARFNGRIEELFINFTGQNVTKGQPLAIIFSPQLVTAQKELLEAIKYKDTNPEFYNSAKGKLKLWDLTEQQIESIINSAEPILYFEILSPLSGTVSNRHISVGNYVKQGQQLFMVNDLSKLWIMFDAYQSDLPWISVNDKIEFSFPSISGKTIIGKVKHIDPSINPKTRVAKVRVEYYNSDMSIKPEMFVSGIVKATVSKNKNKLSIPKTSVLWTGKRAVVYVKIKKRDQLTFLYREIVLGPEASDYYIVESGLEEGEEIATNGVFKIDASAQLMGLQSMMNPDGGKPITGHNHGESKMSEQEMDRMDKALNIDLNFKNQLTEVYKKYIILKDAFVASDAKKASTAAKELTNAISKVDMKLLKGNSHIAWMEQMKILLQTSKAIAGSIDIDKQRVEFVTLNLTFYKSIKMFGLSNKTTFYQYCPMANGDKGAYWFSNSKEIKNPYFGNKMLKCGETNQTIEFK